MTNRRNIAKVMAMSLADIKEKQTIPESLIPYTESAETVNDIYQNFHTDYIFSESFTEDEYNMIRTEFEGFIEACVDEFSIGSMLPQPGDGYAVEDDDLAELTRDPWLDKEDKKKENYKIPGPLVEYVNNPTYEYTEVVNDAIEDMIHDPACPVSCGKMSEKLKKPIFDKCLIKSKLRVADNMGCDPYIKRNIESELLDREKKIRGLCRAGYACPEDKEHIKSSMDQLDSLFKKSSDLQYFPRGPIDELDGMTLPYSDECGNTCGECGGAGCSKCGGRGVIDEGEGCKTCESSFAFEVATTPPQYRGQTPVSRIKDDFQIAKRFVEDEVVSSVKGGLNLIGRKLRKIEKTYMSQDSDFVPYKKLYQAKANAPHDDVKSSDLPMSKGERKAVHRAINTKDKFYRNNTVIMMNGKIPWFKFTLDDKLKDSKRHLEFAFSKASAPWANYYRAVVMKQYGLMSPEISDWVDKTYNDIRHKKGAEEDTPEEKTNEEPANNEQEQQPTNEE